MKPIENNGYMQYGCGSTSCPEGWINFDASPTLFLQRMPIVGSLFLGILKPRFPDNILFGDILHGLPIMKDSCKGIYCSHVLEHLSFDDFRLAIKNTHNYLAPNGLFRLIMPDLKYFIEQYIISNNSDSSIEFMGNSLLGVTKRDRSLSGFLRNFYGNSHHLWLWDYESTKRELVNAGFKVIRRAQYLDSIDQKFNEVDDESRWENCLGIECRK